MTEETRPGGEVGLFAELKRRHVIRVAVVYAVVTSGVVQVATTTFPVLGLPDWTTRFVLVLSLLGFPIAVALAWAFELTPDGVRRAEAEGTSPSAGTAPRPGAEAVRVRKVFRLRGAPVAEPRRAPVPAAVPEALPHDPSRERRASLAVLRHELRTPLNAILGYTDMLLEESDVPVPEALTGRLRGVRDRGATLIGGIDEVLRPGREATEQPDLATRRARVREALGRPARELAAEAHAILSEYQAAGELEWVSDLERVVAAADRLTALVESSPQEGVESSAAGDAFGRSREAAERVIARRVVRAGESAPAHHGHLLVVDDNAMNRDLLCRQLARQGYRVSSAADGRAALDAMRTGDFDLVLLDVLMPEMDGTEVLDQMHGDPDLAELPVIMISALDEIDGVVRCIEQGAADYLTKPFDPVLLQARIGSSLEIRRLRDQQRRAAEQAAELRAWAEHLGSSFLPASLAAHFARQQENLVEAVPTASVLALELEGTEALASRGGGDTLMAAMERVIEAVQEAVAGAQVDVLWLGGRSCLIATGLGGEAGSGPETVATIAHRLAHQLGQAGTNLPIRAGMGIHVGPAVVGVLGGERVVCGVWGEAVEIAQGLARVRTDGAVYLSPAACTRLRDAFELDPRGVAEVGRAGQMKVYRLVGARAAAPA